MTTRIFHKGKLDAGISISLEAETANHVHRVLRLSRDDTLVVFNGDGRDYSATITSASRNSVRLRVNSHTLVGNESPLDVCILQGISRGQRMDWLIQKATELGVTKILPVHCARSVVRLDEERREKKRDHWLRVAASACEQCGRATVPGIGRPTDLSDALLSPSTPLPEKPAGARLVLDPGGKRSVASAVKSASRVVLLIGPEGGLTEGELAMAHDAGFTSIRLGPRVLRTETAPIAALSIIQYLAGDLK